MNRQKDSLTSKISEWALRCPEKIAIKSESKPVNYWELENRSNQIANFFHEKLLGNPHVIIILERSALLIEAIIGLLKCGLIFIPIDPLLPINRIKKMIEESRTEWVITDKKYHEKFQDIFDSLGIEPPSPGLNVCVIDPGHQGNGQYQKRFYLNPGLEKNEPAFESVFNEHCYIYFTSGSTGTPKGILGRQKGLIHFIQWEMNEFGVNEHFNVSQMPPPSFDVFLRDIFLPLMAGGTCCIPSRQTLLDMKQLIRWIDDNEITLIHTVPSLFKQLVSEIQDTDCFQRLKYILLAGELLRGEDIRHFVRVFKQRIGLVNIYGPTETTLAKCFYRIQPGDENRSIIPVGKPIDGAQVLILGSQMQKCPPGRQGEIYIRTPFRSAGYYNQPGLTESVFIKNPYGQHPDDLIYKTGDLGRLLPDGNTEVCGRIDFQVKIRGIRIEIGEIENRLLTHPDVHDAVVMAWADQSGDKYLCAYVKSTSCQHLYPADLKKYLENELPDVMIPSYFVQMERFPLTPSGKIDRHVLPEPIIEAGENFVAPANEIEKKLLKVWSEVLNKDETKISVQADFFEVGGHSLKAATLAAKIHKEFNVVVPLAEFFRTMTIRGLSEYIRDTEKVQHLDIEPAEKKSFHPLSSAQKRLYFLQMMEKSSCAYNIPRVLKLEERLDVQWLESVFNKLIQRHESLRTSFVVISEEPVQKILDEVEFEIEYKNLPPDYTDNKYGRGAPPWSPAIIKSFIRPFNLSKAPLLRVGLVELEEEQHILIVDMHHIISDGISIQVLVQDFAALYAGQELPGIKLQYKDYAEWQDRERVSKNIQEQGEYWKKEFAGEIPVLEIPADFTRPAVQAFEGNRINFEISKENSSALKDLALESGSTLYAVLLAMYTILLAKLSNQEDIVVGSPVAGRRHADLEKIIGMFVNTLVLRNYPVGEKRFIHFLEEVKEIVLKAFENQDYQYEELVEKIVLTRDTSRNPLFDTMFVLQNMEIAEINIPGLKLSPYPYENKTSKFDLCLTAVEAEEKLFFNFEYSTKLFKEETANRFITYFKNIVNSVIENKNRKIADYEFITEEEKNQILYDFNDTEAEYPKDKTIHGLFAEQAAQTPDAVALVARETREKNAAKLCAASLHITYLQLHRQSDKLAGILIEKGVMPDAIVGIMMERSIEMIIGIFGILKAGGAYLPIDPGYPQERIDYMLKDSCAAILLTNEKEMNCQLSIVNCHLLMSEHKAPLHHSSFITHHSNQLAYIIYTSGSTGKPKGVMAAHRNVVLYLHAFFQVVNIEPTDTIIQLASYTFDLSVEEIFPILLKGGKILIPYASSGLLDIDLLSQAISKHKVSIVDTTPLVLNEFNKQYLSLKNIRIFISGGDKLKREYVDNLLNIGVIYNSYGPTETTVACIFHRYPGNEKYRSNIPIGKPITGYNIYIINQHGRLQPIGVGGELCISGDGVSRGYLNRPELTAEKFTTSPNEDGTRMYRTGDFGKWLTCGNIEFLGRIDYQVKIRGFRIELGEIENRLLKYPGIKEAVVLAREEDGRDKSLCAYIVSDGEYELEELREFLSKEFPDYMIPSYFVLLEKIPLTPNGKVDRKALPRPEFKAGQDHVAPRNSTEVKLVRLWADVLNIQPEIISIDQNFFELGGHSLKATVLASRIHKEFDVILPLGEIFKAPTIKDIGKYIENAKSTIYKNIDWNLVLIKEGLPGDNHLFFIHDGSGEVEGYVEFCKHLTHDFNCWGIRADRLENLAPRNVTIRELAEKYISSMKKIQPHGPYHIAGWSLGGTIAFEMTAQLEQMNEEIAFLALVDSPPPHRSLWSEAGEFNFESEFNLIKEYSPASEWIEKAKDAPGLNQLWVSLVDYLEASHYDVEIIMKTIAEFGVQALPNFHQLDIKESIYYLNLGRTLRNARALYKPSGKNQTPVHYFAASESKEIPKECWNNYCHEPVTFFEITGDHFSIFKMPNVQEFAKFFEKIL